MVRYLLFFSYIGTKFNGSQRQVMHGVHMPRVSTVQDVIESGLAVLKPSNLPPKMAGSSRTDAGVHAFSSSGHADLHHFIPGKYYKPDVITYALNAFFRENDNQIRIIRTVIVPDDFHCRSKALHRTYVYRIAVVKKDILPQLEHLSLAAKFASFTPISEQHACSVVYPPCDIEAMKRGVRLFLGTHNFTSFSKKPGKNDRRPPRNPVRNMEVAEITPGTGILSALDPTHENLDYWNITFRSSGFLYRQVRRMVGTLLTLGAGRMTEKDIQSMLDNPCHESWDKMNVGRTPPHGLFLKKVTYDEKDFALPSDYFHVIETHKCSYSTQKNYVYKDLINVLAGRMKQLSDTTSDTDFAIDRPVYKHPDVVAEADDDEETCN